MSEDKVAYKAFILRLWHEPELRGAIRSDFPQWRASVEDIDTKQVTSFSDISALIRFLLKMTEPISVEEEIIASLLDDP